MMELLVVVLTGLVLGRGRVPWPWSERPYGTTIRRIRLPFLARLRMQAMPSGLLLALATAGGVLGLLSPVSVALVPIIIVGFLVLPVAYTVTSEGIAVGGRGFRRWTEFGGVARRPGGARLQAVGGRRGMNVWLGGSRDDDDFVLLLRRLVRGSYQGHAGSVPERPPGQDVPQAVGARGLKPAGAAQ